MTILATESGWLISGKIVRETDTYYIFEPSDKYGCLEHKVRKDGTGSKQVFESVDEALAWMD